MTLAVRADNRPPRTLPSGIDGGIYLPSEAARLTGLPPTTLRRWLDLEGASSGLISRRRERLLSFYDVIDLRAVAALRRTGLTLPRIEAGADTMRRERKLAHPLAWEALRIDGVPRYFAEARSGVGANGEHCPAQEIVAAYLRDVRYEAVAEGYRLASSWESPSVSIGPLIQRGAPCVAGSRVQIAQLKGYLDAGDTPDQLAALFELDADDMRRAVQWYASSKPAA